MREKKNEQRQKPKCIEIRSPSCRTYIPGSKPVFYSNSWKSDWGGWKKIWKIGSMHMHIYIHILGALSIFAQPNKLQTREWVWDSYLLHLIWHCSCSAHIQFHRRLFSHQTKWQTKAIQPKPQPLLVLCASVSLCYSVLSNEQAKR